MANTSAPLSETSIANFGAAILDEQALNSLDDSTTYGRLCAREFGYARDELLRSHPWSFNKKMVLLAPDVDAPPFRWDYAYTLPTDCIRMYPLREYTNGPKIPFEKFQRKIYTDKSVSLPLVYGARITNAAEFDPLFARALGSFLGLLGAQRVTGKANYVDKARQMFADALQSAIHVNSLEMGGDEYVDYGDEGSTFDVLDVRGVGFGS